MKHLFKRFLLVVTASAMLFTSCEKDDDPVIPKASFEKETYSVEETSTTVLEVPVTLDEAAPQDMVIAFSVAGTATEGVNYVGFESKQIEVAAGSNTGLLLLSVMKEAAIDGDKTLEITLEPGTGYQLGQGGTTTTITILDNSQAAADAPTVQFTSSASTVTNAYLQETLTVNLGISKALAEDVLIPVSFSGSAVAGTNFTTNGLTDNNEVLLSAGEMTASFEVAVLYTGEINIDKSFDISLATPVTTEYALASEATSVNYNIIDPEVENIWFLERSSFTDQSGNEQIVVATNAEGECAYNEEGRPLPSVINKGVFQPDVERLQENSDGVMEYRNTSIHYLSVHPTEPNMWTAGEPFIYHRVDDQYDETPFYPYYYAYSSGTFDFGDLFTDDYLVGYRSEHVAVDKFMRFAATNAEGTAGMVVIPEQTITVYRAVDGYEWKGKTDAGTSDAGYVWGEQYNYKINSHESLGVIANSDYATPVEVTVSGEGTFDAATKLITYTVTFSSEDSNLLSTEEEYRLAPLRDDMPN